MNSTLAGDDRMLARIDHLVVVVADLDASRRAYVSLLGRSPSWSGAHPQFGTCNVIFKLDNTYIELLSPVEEGAVADGLRAGLEESGDGLRMIALGTPDIEAAARTLAERGLQVGEPVAGLAQDGPSGAFRRFRNLFLSPRDTAGVGLFLIEHLSDPDELPPSLPTAEPDACVSALDHVVVLTEAPERAKRFYGETLGIRLALDKTFEARKTRLLFFRLGGATLEIGASLGATGDDDGSAPDDRLWGMALQVQDIDLAHARLTAAGVPVSGIRPGNKAGTRVCSVKGDPLGVPTLIIQPVSR